MTTNFISIYSAEKPPARNQKGLDIPIKTENYIFELEASNENLDLQGQVVLQRTLLDSEEFFLKNGVISNDHQHRRKDENGNVIVDSSMNQAEIVKALEAGYGTDRVAKTGGNALIPEDVGKNTLTVTESGNYESEEKEVLRSLLAALQTGEINGERQQVSRYRHFVPFSYRKFIEIIACAM